MKGKMLRNNNASIKNSLLKSHVKRSIVSNMFYSFYLIVFVYFWYTYKSETAHNCHMHVSLHSTSSKET